MVLKFLGYRCSPSSLIEPVPVSFTPGMTVLRAIDVNDDGFVIGGGWTPDDEANLGLVGDASGKEARDLGTLSGWAEVYPSGINNMGEIVDATGAESGLVRAVCWPPGASEPIDLDTLVSIPGETRLVESMDINNSGQILARGFTGYYILTPVPEPAAAFLAGAALIGMRYRPVGAR